MPIPGSYDFDAVAITPNGRLIVSAAQKSIDIWELNSGEKVRTFKTRLFPIENIIIMPDSSRALMISKFSMGIMDLEQGKEVIFGRTGGKGYSHRIDAVALTSDGKKIVAACSDNTIKIWDLNHLRLNFYLKGLKTKINAIALTPDGKRIVSASVDGTITVCNYYN